MGIAEISIVALLLLFAATALRSFNLGLAALSAAFILGLAAGVPTTEVTGFFPADFFVLIVGVTALFAVAQVNGTMDWLLSRLLAAVRGRVALMALVPFIAGAVLTSVGTLPAAATAIVAPIALGLAARYVLPPLLMAVLGIMGILSGLLSPLAVYGVTARQLSTKFGLDLPSSAPVVFFVGGIVAGTLMCIGSLAVARLRGVELGGRIDGSAAESVDGADKPPVAGLATRSVTLTSMAAVIVLSVGFDLNIGYLAICAATIGLLILRMDPVLVVARMPWAVVLLIGGILTYIGLMEHLGAFERVSDILRVDDSPALSLLVLCYVAGVTSFAASSIAVFATTMPLVPAVVAQGASPVGAVLAIALASVLVDINPLGITGGLILGSAAPEHRPRLFRQMLIFGLVSVVVAPVLTWALFSWW